MLQSSNFQPVNSNILIAVDGSKYSEIAAGAGVELAKALNAAVTFLCVVDISNITLSAQTGGAIDKNVLDIYHRDAEETIDAIVKKYPYSKIKKLTPDGLPAETILTMAQSIKADMIVMGTHGRTGISHLLMGSITTNVVRHSHIPVLVIPGKE